MKLVLEDICVESGVEILLNTRVVAAEKEGRRMRRVITESKSGREALEAAVFIDCTGDGDLAARAGCGFDMGSLDGQLQPATLMAAITVPDLEAVAPYIAFYQPPEGKERPPWRKLTEYLLSVGIDPSYHAGTLFQLRGNLLALMINHQYGVDATDARSVTLATIEARREINRVVDQLSRGNDIFQGCQLVTTAGHIGIREGRRIHGRYTVTEADIARGARFDDTICRVRFNVDIHSTNPKKGKAFDTGSSNTYQSMSYDIPLRALISHDVDGLLMAGRCISGDWVAHGSYRVTGEAISMGEAAGTLAAVAVKLNVPPHDVPYDRLREQLPDLDNIRQE